MSKKKHKSKKSPPKQTKANFIDIHWNKIVIILILILPLIYFLSFLSADKMIAGSDYLIGGYPFERWTEEQSEMPLWYPHVFGGVPVLGAPVGGPLAPLAQLRAFIPPHVVLTITFIIVFFLAGLGTFLYLKAIGLSKYTAAFGAVTYMFIGNLATTPYAGHAGRAASVALFPLMLFFVHRGLELKKLLYFILTALVTAFAFYEGHFQITYYALLLILCYTVYYLISKRKELSKMDVLKILGYGLGSIVLIFLLMAAVWLPVLGGLGTAARGIERGYEYAISWAMPSVETIDLFVPSFSGILGNYWGSNPFKQHTEYFGLLTIIFAVFAIILYWKKPLVKFYAIAAVAVILTAWGGATPFFRILYTIVPGFKLTRAPALIFYLASFSFITLAAIGFEYTIIKKKLDQRKFFIASGVLLGIFIILMLIGSAVGRDVADAKLNLYEKNLSHFTQGVVLGLILISLALGMIFLAFKKKVNNLPLTVAAIVISLTSLLPLMAKFLPEGPSPQTYYVSDDVIHYLKNDRTVFRVFPTPWYEHSADLYFLYHNIHSAGGYIPNPIQRYQEFIGAGTSVMFRPVNLLQHHKFLDMLNIKYIIGPTLPEDVSRYDMQSQKTISELKNYFSKLTLLSKGQKYSVYLNNSVLPRVYMVPQYRVVEETEVLEAMKLGSFDPKQTVILEQDPEVTLSNEALSLIPASILEYTANKIICSTNAPYPGFLVLTDNWHPDWKVFVDGKEKKLFRANYTFRAVHVPAGKHEVVFAYISSYFITGKIISILALVLSIGLCILTIKFKT